MSPTPDQIAMATRIAQPWKDAGSLAYSIAYGAALAAILETSELAAKHMGAAGQSWAEKQPRAGEHLKDNAHD